MKLKQGSCYLKKGGERDTKKADFFVHSWEEVCHWFIKKKTNQFYSIFSPVESLY